MKRFLIIPALLLGLALLAGCTKDGISEETAIKGNSSTVTGWGLNGAFKSGSAFMYKSDKTCCFLLCEGKANSWSAALKKPHIEIHISKSYIYKNAGDMVDTSKSYDINETPSHIYVCWDPGNGHRFYNKPNLSSDPGSYPFKSGSLNVCNLHGTYTIAFSGQCSDNKSSYTPGWSYAGQF